MQLARVGVRVLVLVDVVCVMLVVLIAHVDVVHAVDTVIVAIFHSWRCTLYRMGMVLGFEGGIVGSTYGANETQHGNRVDLEVAQPLNQAFGEASIFNTRCMIFLTYLACRTSCMSRNSSQFSEIHVRNKVCSSLPY